MATEKQIAANRANAQKSTGPTSIAGKNKTRLNATRDGITGQVITLSEEDLPIFEKLKKEMIDDLAPKTVMEIKLASSIAWDTWRLDRLRAIDTNTFAIGTQNPANDVGAAYPELHTALSSALTFEQDQHRFALLSLYEQRLNRALHKNLATLRSLQAERKRNRERDKQEEVLLARYAEIKGLAYHAPTRPTPNGSVFSNAEIFAAANRESTVDVAKLAVKMAPSEVQYAGASDNYDPDRPNSGPHPGLDVMQAA
jgi:hypothetical protein